MAKPFVVQPSSSPGPSKPSPFHLQSSTEEPEQLRHRDRRPRVQPLSKAAPSVTLLSLLASLASASTAYGSPAPPSFLCPTLESGEIADCAIVKRAPPTHRVVDIKNAVTPAPRRLPDRYSQQPDGAWRRISYTLYGSTMPACSSSSCATPTPAVISPLDDQIQVGDNTDTTTTTPIYDIQTDLPPGWKPLEKHTRTAVILLISLCLALFIGSFIVGCMVWRKRAKSRRKSRDVEARAKKKCNRNNEADALEIILEKEIKAKQKIWARATARWRSNARYSARQRRGRRLSSRLSQSNQSTASFDNPRSCLAESSTSSQSRPSPRSSTVFLNEPLVHDEVPDTPSSSSGEAGNTTPVTSTLPARISPPAYHHHGQIPSLVVSPTEPDNEEFSPVSTPVGKARTLNPSHSYATLSDLSQSSTHVHLHAAHVATDDKALLARLADLASAPPEDNNEGVSGSALHTSAPEWHDEDLEDIAPHLLSHSPTRFSFSPMFPPPPSKGRLAAAEFYNYSYTFEEAATPDLDAGPSAPPFEEGSSAAEQELIPSAPPMFDNDQPCADAQPSAPTWDPSSECEHQEHEPHDTSGRSLDQAPSEDTSTDRGPSPGTPPVRSRTVLPGYQP